MGGTRRSGRGRAAPRAGWRAAIDSFGGFWVVGSIGAAIIAIALIVFFNRPGKDAPGTVSTRPLMGELVNTPDRTHVNDPKLLQFAAGQPPVGGPHFATAQALGVYDKPVPDGNAVHALEHGIVWISYQPDRLDAAALERLRQIARAYDRDVILSPRPDNSMTIAAASWMRLLRLDALDEQQVRAFIETNRNRSPEPFVR